MRAGKLSQEGGKAQWSPRTVEYNVLLRLRKVARQEFGDSCAGPADPVQRIERVVDQVCIEPRRMRSGLSVGVAVGKVLESPLMQEIEEGGRGSFNFGGGVGFRFGRETAAIELLYQQVSDELTSIGIRLIY